MKRKKVIVWLIILAFLFGVVGSVEEIKGLTTPIVTLSDSRPNASNVTYEISFQTSSDKKLQGGDEISITWFYAFNFPQTKFDPSKLTVNGWEIQVNTVRLYDSSADPNDYWVSITLPYGFPLSSDFYIKIYGLTNPSLQNSWSQTSHYDNNPSINQWRLKVSTSSGTSQLESDWSQPYSISQPSVSNVKVSVSPDTIGDVASYVVFFKTSTNGSLSGASTITILFPSNTVFSVNPIPSNSISIKVGNLQANVSQPVTPSGQEVTFYLPSSIYVGNNTDVQVIFSTACGIKNPSQPGSLYFVQVKTSSDNLFVPSDYYSIYSSKVSNVSVSLTNNTVGSASGYTISFRTSSLGALVKNSSYIYFVFPVGTYLPNTIQKNYIDIDGITLNDNATIEGYTLKIKTPKDIGGLQTVTVTISPAAGIKNPSIAKSDYKVSVFTTSDPGEASSNTFSIIASTITPATVNVEPKVVKLVASYLINFTLGSSGALSQGDEIYITFPVGTIVPQNISQTSISVNGVPSLRVPLVSQNTVTVFAPQFISANSSVIIVIAQQAGIRNPSVPSQSYKLSISTKAENTPISSNPYAIVDSVKTSLIINPATPDGKNGYYISTPKLKIAVSNPANVNYTVYYKLDSSDFVKYTPDLEITIPEGAHVFSYYAEDAYGNKEELKQSQFNVDLTKPQLLITSPDNNNKIKTNVVEIKGKTIEGSKLTVNGSPIKVEPDGSFSYLYTFTKEGPETLTIRSEDLAGNFTESVLNLTYTKQVRIMIQVGNEHCYVNDEDFLLKGIAPYIKNGRVMVPIRFVSEALGFSVEWDQVFKIVSINVDSRKIRLQVNNKTADLFGKVYMLDAPPEIINNTTFVPLRFISENFGASVTWDNKLQIVRIVYPKD